MGSQRLDERLFKRKIQPISETNKKLDATKKFEIEKKDFANQEVIKISKAEGDFWFSLFPSYGGAMHELTFQGQSLLETATDEATFLAQTQKAYSGAQLFPYPNRIKDGTYTWDGTEYDFPINDSAGNNSLHGFVHGVPFEIATLEEENGIVKIAYNYDGSNAGYPFKFRLTNTFQLLEKGVEIVTKVGNTDNKPIPMGHGWHPYFSFGEQVTELKLQIDTNVHYPIDKDLIPTGKEESFNYFSRLGSIGEFELNHCFKIAEGETKMVSIHSFKRNLSLKIISKDYRFLQVYIPPDRNSIALEPQTCAPDAMNNGIGLITIPPNESKILKVKILIEKSS